MLDMKFKFVFLSALVSVVFVAGFLPCFGVDGEHALLVISEAEARIVTCYEAAADAEGAGANVSQLLSILNETGWLLSRAKLAYSQGNFDSSASFANECQLKLDGFVDQADSLRVNAEEKGYWDFLINFVGSGVGAACVVVGGFAFWVFLKKREEAGRRS